MITGYICGPSIYKFEDWIFEYNPHRSQPWPLKKDLEPRKRAGNKFYSMLHKFMDLQEKEQKKYQIDTGGCYRF